MPRAMPKRGDLAPLGGVPLRFAWEFTVVGARYSKRRTEACMRLRVGDEVSLVRESGNAHDSCAIRVEHDGETLGYVPREQARAWAGALDAGVATRCEVLAVTQKNTVREDMPTPLVWARFYAREQRYELCDLMFPHPMWDEFNDRFLFAPEHCFYVADDDPSGRHRKGDVIVSADEKVVVGLPKSGPEPAVLSIPEGVREVAPWACAQSGSLGVALPGSLEAIRSFAFAEASGWLVRVGAGVRIVEPGAFAGRGVRGNGWRPCYFEVDGGNELLCSRNGSLLERVPAGLRLLSLYFDYPPVERDHPEVPCPGLDYRVPDGVTSLAPHSAVQGSWIFSSNHLSLPASLRELEHDALLSCNYIADFNLPEGLSRDGTTKQEIFRLLPRDPATCHACGGPCQLPASSRFVAHGSFGKHGIVVHTVEGDVVCPASLRERGTR